AEFEIIDLRVIPENPKVGDTLTILVDVRNKGDTSGSYTVLVTIGSKSKTQNVELEGKSSKTVEFQDTADAEGDIEIKAGNLTKTITVASLETPTPTTTPAPTTPTTPKPTAAPEESNRINRPDYEMGTRLNYLFTVRGDEWGSTIAYNSPYEGDRTPWFRWGTTDWWSANPDDTYWRGDYEYWYTSNWDLRGVISYKIGGTKAAFNLYVLNYEPDLPCIYPLVKGAEKIHTGRIDPLMILGVISWTGSAPEGRGNYERKIYIEEFEDIEAGGKTYRCAKVKYYMEHSVDFLAPHINEDWGRMKWIEEGYHWYSDIGLVKTEVTIKTYWWDELEKTDKVSIILTGVTLP
ncbi:MAG: hypothetical protein KAT49_07445, partial [Methanomicrobia archaeon]|nr:hypothetical protein [Methanomicrobia archaeon]